MTKLDGKFLITRNSINILLVNKHSDGLTITKIFIIPHVNLPYQDDSVAMSTRIRRPPCPQDYEFQCLGADPATMITDHKGDNSGLIRPNL